MSSTRFFAAAIVAAPLLLAGCGGGDAEKAVKELTGTEEGSDTESKEVVETPYVVEEIKRIKDAKTGEVIGEQTSTTDVVVQEEIKVERDTDVEAGETTTQTRGHVPEELKDQ